MGAKATLRMYWRTFRNGGAAGAWHLAMSMRALRRVKRVKLLMAREHELHAQSLRTLQVELTQHERRQSEINQRATAFWRGRKGAAS